MNHSVSVLRQAVKQLERLPTADQARILDSLDGLRSDPRPPGCIKLTGRPAWRIRAGDYRVIYEIDDAARSVLVVAIGHRRDIYR